MLLGFVFVVMGITLLQESKAEQALEALRNLASPRARVICGGEHTNHPIMFKAFTARHSTLPEGVREVRVWRSQAAA